MNRITYTRVGELWVPVYWGKGPTEVWFYRGRKGRMERGWYRFFTAFGEDRYGVWLAPVRTRRWRPVGWRFEQLLDVTMWKRRLATIQWIEPSSVRETWMWLDAHMSGRHNDAEYARFWAECYVRGRYYKRGLPYKFV